MSWEVRGNRRYYRRKRRIDGRMVKVYVGTGPMAEREAELDAQRRAKREAEREAARAAEACCNEALTPVEEVTKLIDLLMRATLISEGHYQHDRGAWRTRRRQI